MRKVLANKAVRSSVLRIKKARRIVSLERNSLIQLAIAKGLNRGVTVRFERDNNLVAEVILVPRVRIFK